MSIRRSLAQDLVPAMRRSDSWPPALIPMSSDSGCCSGIYTATEEEEEARTLSRTTTFATATAISSLLGRQRRESLTVICEGDDEFEEEDNRTVQVFHRKPKVGSSSNHNHNHKRRSLARDSKEDGASKINKFLAAAIRNKRQIAGIFQHYYPEGNWGYVILTCAFLAQALSNGVQMSFGILSVAAARRWRMGLMGAAEGNKTMELGKWFSFL